MKIIYTAIYCNLLYTPNKWQIQLFFNKIKQPTFKVYIKKKIHNKLKFKKLQESKKNAVLS